MFLPMPDVDQAFVDFIDSHPSLTPLHGGRVGTRLAAGSLTSVRIASLGGGQPWPWESQPEYQVEWWGGTQAEAKLLARTGESVLWEFLGPITGGRVTGVAIPLSQLWSPDETTDRARFLTQVQYRVHPEAS